MIKVGITGSLASGKTTASKYLSNRRGPLFSADTAVKELYKSPRFRGLIIKKFKLQKISQIKKTLKKLILSKNSKRNYLIYPC